jgi:hypothetical protein
VVPALAIARRRELGHTHVPRIEWTRQASDCATLPGCVPALEQDEYRRSERAVAEEPCALEPEGQQPMLRDLEALDPLGF